MRTYANPSLCPGCDQPVTGSERCTRCGIRLTGPQALQVLSLFSQADRILGSLRSDADHWRSQIQARPVGGQMPPTYTPPMPPFPGHPRPAGPATPSAPRWSTGTLLLALGALCLIVAAFVFVSVSWGSIGLLGRTLILLVVTAVSAAVAITTTVKRLRASSESMWTLTWVLLTFDFVAATSAGLLGLDALSDEAATLVYGLMMVILLIPATLWSRSVAGKPLVTTQIATVAGVYAVLVAVGALVPVPSFWVAVVLFLLALVIATGGFAVRLPVVGVATLVAAVVAYLVALTAALVDVAAHRGLRELWLEGYGAQVVALAALTAALGLGLQVWLGRHPRAGIDAGWVASITGMLVIGLAVALVYAPASAEGITGSTITACAVALVLCAVGVADLGAWGRGVRVAAWFSVLPVTLGLAVWCSSAIATIAEGIGPVWESDFTGTLAAPIGGPGPTWLASVLAVSVAGCLALVACWRRSLLPTTARPYLLVTSLVTLATAAVVHLGLHRTPVVLVAGAALAGAIVAVVVSLRRRNQVVELAGAAGVGLASVLPLHSQTASLAIWAAALVVLALITALSGSTAVRPVAAAGSAIWATGCVLNTGDLVDVSDRGLQLCAIVTSILLAGFAQLLRGDRLRRMPAEGVAAVGAGIGLVAGFPYSLGWQSLTWTIVGAATAAITLLVPDRRRLAPGAAAILAVAYVLRLAASDVGVVEAYTLPFAILLLGAGLLAMRRNPRLRSRTVLVPGLALGLLPSLPLVLDDPTTLRGLLLGLGSLAVLGLGLATRWQAPFVAGVAMVAVLAVRHLGPYADAVPRWVLIAAAGLALLVTGITWERRVRDARAATLLVRSMR